MFQTLKALDYLNSKNHSQVHSIIAQAQNMRPMQEKILPTQVKQVSKVDEILATHLTLSQFSRNEFIIRDIVEDEANEHLQVRFTKDSEQGVTNIQDTTIPHDEESVLPLEEDDNNVQVVTNIAG